MSTSQPTDFGGYLATANAVKGPDIPDRPNHANFTEACLQEGLTDAAGHIYDKISFASVAPMTFERRCSNWLGFALSKAMDKRHDDLYLARDIIARTRAALVRVQEQRIQSEADLQEVEQQIETARSRLMDPTHPSYEPLADILSEPGLDDWNAGRPTERLPSLWSQMAVDGWTSFREHSWKKTFLWIALVAGEIGLIYGIALQLGDSENTGVLVAVSLSALAVGTGWLAIPTLLRGPAGSRSRKVLSWIALFLYVITMLALGWLRYVYMRPEVVVLLEKAATDPKLIVTVPWYGDLLFYLLWVALPLALTASIALLETHHSSDRENSANGGVSGSPDSKSAATGDTADHPSKTAFRSESHSGDRQRMRARGQIVGHLKYLRTRRTQLQDQVITLKAEEAHGQTAQEDAKLNESALNERTRLYLQSLPEMIGEGFVCYLKGLERGFSDPTMTAHIQEAAEAFLLRYTETAYTKVNEYLVYLNEHRHQPAPEATHAGDL
ncbi:hypothetical protein AB4Y72_15075 [Arthrobacter sp. YAF34]|uniref:hypothetical protein n=1 Tax=Arthrobacter sp. YAF34 TaxID=3233083 RepID=UPI003F91BDC8